MTEEAKEKAIQELHRLEAMPPMSAEGTVSRTYIDWLLSVPWKQKTKEIRDITKAEDVLPYFLSQRVPTGILGLLLAALLAAAMSSISTCLNASATCSHSGSLQKEDHERLCRFGQASSC